MKTIDKMLRIVGVEFGAWLHEYEANFSACFLCVPIYITNT